MGYPTMLLAVVYATVANGHGDTIGSSACTWVENTDYVSKINNSWHVENITSKEECCALCQSYSECDFAVFNPTELACWPKHKESTPFCRQGDVGCCPSGTSGCPSAPGPGWSLLQDFSDEFLTDLQGKPLPINMTRWNTSVDSWGDWTWSQDNVAVVPASEADSLGSGGYLAVTMTYEPHTRDGQQIFYKSGILKSTFPSGVTYGRFEARIKGASRWPGVCPAFWAYRHGDGYWTELDFVEMLENWQNETDIDFTSHVFPPTPGVEEEISNSTHTTFQFDPRDDFHVYAMEWNATQLTWWVDDDIVKVMPAFPYFDRKWPMDVVISMGLRNPLKKTPSAEGFPTTFYVDWVRVWQRGGA